MIGSYTTQRDGGLTYTYEAVCEMQGTAWHWSAKVRRDGQLMGTPNGVLLNARSFIEDPVLQQMVEDAIEGRIGVD